MNSVRAKHPFYDLDADMRRDRGDLFECEAERAEYLASIGYVWNLGEHSEKPKPSAASANTKKTATKATRKRKTCAAK